MRQTTSVRASVVVIVKDDARVGDLLSELARQLHESDEVIVVDASHGRLDAIRHAHPNVRWIPFTQPTDVKITIPHQRNVGVRTAVGRVVVFIDADCRPLAGWLDGLIEPITAGRERICAGGVQSRGARTIHDRQWREAAQVDYLEEAPTQNIAIERAVFNVVGEFDEGLRFGSDVDFTWRARSKGVAIRSVSAAVIEHDWGTRRHQLRRAFLYGEARARLYKKHPSQWRRLVGPDAPRFVYFLYLLGAPLARQHPVYLALLVVPLMKNRGHNAIDVVVTNLASAVGSLREVACPASR